MDAIILKFPLWSSVVEYFIVLSLACFSIYISASVMQIALLYSLTLITYKAHGLLLSYIRDIPLNYQNNHEFLAIHVNKSLTELCLCKRHLVLGR